MALLERYAASFYLCISPGWELFSAPLAGATEETTVFPAPAILGTKVGSTCSISDQHWHMIQLQKTKYSNWADGAALWRCPISQNKPFLCKFDVSSQADTNLIYVRLFNEFYYFGVTWRNRNTILWWSPSVLYFVWPWWSLSDLYDLNDGASFCNESI